MDRQDILDAIQDTRDEIRVIRKQERKFNQVLDTVANSPLELKGRMGSFLPPDFVPENIGKMSNLVWPQFYEFTIDYSQGANAFIGANDLAKSDYVQISQEAAFLALYVHRDSYAIGKTGTEAPLGVTIRDNSSTRTLNQLQIPLQSIGKRIRPTKLDVPFLVHPNASLNVEMKSLWPNDIQQDDVSGIHKIVISGLRINPNNIANVMKKLLLS